MHDRLRQGRETQPSHSHIMIVGEMLTVEDIVWGNTTQSLHGDAKGIPFEF